MAQVFGLDFDGTAEAAPKVWRVFIDAARAAGHQVFITTARRSDDLADVERMFPDVEIVATNGLHKDPVCQSLGVYVDVWIDDMPEIIKEEAWRPATAG